MVYDLLDRPSETNLLVLSYRNGPEAWLQGWRTYVGDLPSEVGFVHIGVKTRSATAFENALSDPPVASTPLPADAVSDPSDLARVGINASEYLESWDGNGAETVVYLDSVTEMLEHADLERVFKFLFILAARVESVGGRVFCLVDPSAHDEYSLRVIREIADDVVDLDDPPSV